MPTDGPTKLNLAFAEPGANNEMLKATEIVVQLLNGFTNVAALSVLTNSTAMVLANMHSTETSAIDETRRFHREVERCIRRNYSTIKKEADDQSRR